MNISINNIQIDKDKILLLIQKQKKIVAIKYIREQLHIGLKESKGIVDNLEKDPTYYDGENHNINMIPLELFNATNHIKTSQKIKNHQQKRTPFIERTKTSSKTYIIIALVVCIIILIYLYITK